MKLTRRVLEHMLFHLLICLHSCTAQSFACSPLLATLILSLARSFAPSLILKLMGENIVYELNALISYSINSYCDGLLKVSEQETEKEQVKHSSKYRHVLARTSYYYLKVAQIVILSCFRTVSNPILVKNVTFT